MRQDVSRTGRNHVVSNLSLLAAGAGLAFASSLTPQAAADPWADNVVSYDEGTGANQSFVDPTAALGEPTRITDPNGQFGGPVTPFAAPFGQGELVTLGDGGQLTVSFDEAVTDDPLNPFGIDLLIFGNAFYFDGDFPNGVASGGFFTEGGVVELSANGVDFFTVNGVDADGLFPTSGFNDTGSTTPSDFTLPVDPGFSITQGDLLGDILAAYDGSGGGTGIDIASVGLSEVSFVRISNPLGSGISPEIDAFADVAAIPEPTSAAALVALSGFAALRRRRA